jgi:uncharacterized protein YyaL (SSP411 family)
MSPLARSFLAPLLLTTCVSAETAVSRAEAALTTLQSWYNESTGIWNTCGWWNGANCMTVLADLALVDDSESVNNTAKEVFANTFTVGPNSNPYPDRSNGSYYETAVKRSASSVDASLWLDGSYDDDAWWALAWIAAYDVTGKQDYLDVAIGIFDHLVSILLAFVYGAYR